MNTLYIRPSKRFNLVHDAVGGRSKGFLYANNDATRNDGRVLICIRKKPRANKLRLAGQHSRTPKGDALFSSFSLATFLTESIRIHTRCFNVIPRKKYTENGKKGFSGFFQEIRTSLRTNSLNLMSLVYTNVKRNGGSRCHLLNLFVL